MIALVRHADAGKRGTQRDEERPLNANGLAQAAGLVERLSSFKLAHVLSSPYLRCRQTVEPLATARGLALEPAEVLAEGHGPSELLPLMVALAAPGAALCSHGDVIGEMVGHLVDLGLVKREDARFAKGSIWLLDIVEGAIVGARYLSPG